MEIKRAKSPDDELSIAAFPQILRDIGSPWGEAVSVEVRPAEDLGRADRPGKKPGRSIFKVDISWASQRQRFIAVANSTSTPKAVKEAIERAREASDADSAALAMILVPFLSNDQAERLIREKVSGLDLCGNGVIVVPEQLLLCRTGRPNTWPDSRPTKYAYRGMTSLVPRVFLCKREFKAVGEIKEEIQKRGGSVVLSTVSKALTRMVEDVVISRESGSIRLVQPNKLLDMLAEQFEQPKIQERVRLRGRAEDLFRLANEQPRQTQLVMSGASSQDRYAAGLRSDDPIVYCKNIRELERILGDSWTPDERFGDLTVAEPSDDVPFFDARTEDGDITYASPVQAYLELNATKEKRDRDMARSIRERILKESSDAAP